MRWARSPLAEREAQGPAEEGDRTMAEAQMLAPGRPRKLMWLRPPLTEGEAQGLVGEGARTLVEGEAQNLEQGKGPLAGMDALPAKCQHPPFVT